MSFAATSARRCIVHRWSPPLDMSSVGRLQEPYLRYRRKQNEISRARDCAKDYTLARRTVTPGETDLYSSRNRLIARRSASIRIAR